MKREYLVGGLVVALLGLLMWAVVEGRSETVDPQAAAREQRLQVEIESGLKNAATAAETYAVDNNGSYEFADESDLIAMGLQLPPNVAVALLETEESRYCIILEHARLPADHAWKIASYSSDVGTPMADDDCP